MSTVQQTKLSIPLFGRGKVRDVYDMGNELLMVATDRISAYDVVLPTPIPDKGKVLNQISAFWFEKTSQVISNHIIEVINDVKQLNARYPARDYNYPDYLAGRSMLVKKAQRLSVECVVRGYLTGSAWEEYSRTGLVCGISLPQGLKECQQLPQPIFTPTTKAESGHDRGLSNGELIEIVGEKNAYELGDKTMAIYYFAMEYALSKGIIIADTKLEFGIVDGNIILIDELLTPDSSRFWDVATYEVGHPQPSFDKQPLRDWLIKSGWNTVPPAPDLPPEIVQQTAERYKEAYNKLTGEVLQ